MSSEKSTKKKKNSSWGTIIPIVLMVIGLGIIAYPSISNYWNSLHQSRAISKYVRTVAEMDDSRYQELWEAAQAYNRALVDHPLHWELTEEETKAYEKILDVSGTGIMGYIEIPKIGCALPIYHGINETVLQIAIGHLPNSSLPVGGETSHTLLSGHRGLPSARLFTDIDRLEIGDQFFIRVLGETLAYEVDDIRVVLPSDLSTLGLVKGQDYCTLITCTPYGVNTHRLLVRGRRIELEEEMIPVEVTPEAIEIPRKNTILYIVIPVLFILLVAILLIVRKKSKKHKETKVQGGRHESTEENESMEDKA